MEYDYLILSFGYLFAVIILIFARRRKMGVREDAEMIQLLKSLDKEAKLFHSQQLAESRKQNAILMKVLRKLSDGGGPKPADPAVTGRFAFIDDAGHEMVGKMKLKANFKGTKKFRVSFADEGGNAADVQSISLDQVNPELALLVAKMDRVGQGVYEGEMSISGKVGSSKLFGDADGDLGDGVVPIHFESEDIEILPSDAVSAKFEFLADAEPVPEPIPLPEEPVPVEPLPVDPELPVEPPVSVSTKKVAPLRAGASKPMPKPVARK